MTGLQFLYWASRQQTDQCILWPMTKNSKGYGRLSALGVKGRKAHRLAYELFVGEVKDGMVIMHTCDTPACVNPRHLVQGTPKDNTRDMISKGRAAGQLGPDIKVSIEALYKSGYSQVEVADELDISQPVVSKILISLGWRSFYRDNT